MVGAATNDCWTEHEKKTELENSFGNTSIVENQYVEIWDNMVSFRIEMWLSVMSFFGMLVVGI